MAERRCPTTTQVATLLVDKEPANPNIQSHVTAAHAPSNAQKNSDITKAEIEAKLIGEIASHTHAGGSGSGEGHITIIPWNYSSIGAGTWVIGLNVLQALNSYWQNSSHTDLDNISYLVYLAAGTYTLRLITVTGPNGPIIDVDIGGAEIASFDLYSAGVVWNVIKTDTGNVVASAGLKTLRIRVHGKNASATGYYTSFSLIALWRTA